jgi:membrane protease YdiL (CAAX protease family)
LCLVFYIVFIAAMIPVGLLRRSIAADMGNFSAMIIPQIVAWFVTIRLGLQWARVPFGEACPMRPFPLRIVPALLVASYGGTILLLEIAGWIPMPESFQKGMAQEMLQANWLMFLLPVVVVAPVAEELFFRGLLLRGYVARYGVTTAVWASAVVFAVFHLNPWQGVIALPLGVAYAWLALRTASVLPSMLSHAMVNFSTNFLLQPLATMLGYTAAELKTADHFPLEMLGIGAVMAITGCVVVRQQLGRGLESVAAVAVLEPALPLVNESVGELTTNVDADESNRAG